MQDKKVANQLQSCVISNLSFGDRFEWNKKLWTLLNREGEDWIARRHDGFDYGRLDAVCSFAGDTKVVYHPPRTAVNPDWKDAFLDAEIELLTLRYPNVQANQKSEREGNGNDGGSTPQS